MTDRKSDRLREMKRALRQRIIALRDALGPDTRRSFSERICAALLELEAYRKARTVAAYMSVGGELHTGGMVRNVIESGRCLVLPRIDREAGELELYEVADLGAQLKPGVWGIPEPDPLRCRRIADVGSLDFILVPGVAFGPGGERLGYGKGYYDRLLRRAGNRVPRIAGAFSLQVTEGVPMGPGDERVHRVVTEIGSVGPGG